MSSPTQQLQTITIAEILKMTSSGSLPLSLQRPAHEYQQLMESGQLSSENLVNAFINQIDRHNHDGLKLNAILSVCPRDVAASQARRLDEERKRGETRSDLHGVPIIIKVQLYTHPCAKTMAAVLIW